MNYAIDSSGVLSNQLFEELSEEAERYLVIVNELKRTPPTSPKRADLEVALFDSLTHLGAHASMSQKMLFEDLLEDETEEPVEAA